MSRHRRWLLLDLPAARCVTIRDIRLGLSPARRRRGLDAPVGPAATPGGWGGTRAAADGRLGERERCGRGAGGGVVERSGALHPRVS